MRRVEAGAELGRGRQESMQTETWRSKGATESELGDWGRQGTVETVETDLDSDTESGAGEAVTATVAGVGEVVLRPSPRPRIHRLLAQVTARDSSSNIEAKSSKLPDF